MTRKTVMVSGNFEGFHSDHLNYIELAREQGDIIICVVSSDKQLMIKKGEVKIPCGDRKRIVGLIAGALGFDNLVLVNDWDTETPLVAEALRFLKPHIFFRGFDKTPEDMPEEERKACEELGIEVIYARDGKEHNLHSSEIFV